jgi:hypothetical protein
MSCENTARDNQGHTLGDVLADGRMQAPLTDAQTHLEHRRHRVAVTTRDPTLRGDR